MWKRFILGLGFTLLTSSAYAQFLVGGGLTAIDAYVSYHCNEACFDGRQPEGLAHIGKSNAPIINMAYYFPAFSIWGEYAQLNNGPRKNSNLNPDTPNFGARRGPQNPNISFYNHYRFMAVGADYFFRGTDRGSWHIGSGLEYILITNADTGFKYANGVKPIINFGYVWKGWWNIDWDLSWTRQIGKYETNDQSHHFTTSEIRHAQIVGLYRF